MSRAFDKLALIAAPVAVSLLLLALMASDGAAVTRDLQLVAPSDSRPGRPMPVRAFLFEKAGQHGPPRVVSTPVTVQLLDGGERVRAVTRLAPSRRLGVEGHLIVPDVPDGRYRLRARAKLANNETASVEALIQISRQAKRAPTAGRLSTVLQRYAPFALEAREPNLPRSFLLPRVIGGACVPEQRCEMLVWLGARVVPVTLEHGASVTTQHTIAAARGSLARFTFVTHGPEAEVELVASTSNGEVARRRVRLPIALSAPTLRLAQGSLAAAKRPLDVAVAGAEVTGGVLVDGYRDGYWERTGSFEPRTTERTTPLPFADLDPGLWSIEVRTDPFSADASATRWLVVMPAREPSRAALELVARESVRREFQDDVARAVLTRDPAVDASPAADVLAYMLALFELDLHVQPAAVHGAFQENVHLEETQRTVQRLVLLGVVLSAILVAVVLASRGLRAARDARALLALAGDPAADSRRTRWRMTLAVLAMVIVVALTFVAASAFVLARGM